MKNIVREQIKTVGLEFFDRRAKYIIKDLQQLVDEFGENVEFDEDTEHVPFTEERYAVFNVVLVREETDEERGKRLDEITHRVTAQKAKERKEYERLKKKFEDS